MIKKTITYTDFDDNQVTEDHYFHLSKAELLDMLAAEDDIVTRLQRIATSNNGALIMRTFREFIEAAYGERVDNDPRKFYKSAEKTEEFMKSPAFDELLTELVTSEKAAAEFVNGLMPKGLDKLAEASGQQKTEVVKLPFVIPTGLEGMGLDEIKRATGLDNPVDGDTMVPWALREPTNKELASMNAEQMREVYARKNRGWIPQPQ